MEAGYQNCCIGGYCAGSPPSCLCDSGCHQRGDCCPDVNQTCPAGSCAAAGYRACCTDGSSCVGTGGCFCDFACTFFGDCCPDFVDLCPIELGSVIGSCAAAGYSGCCENGTECLGSPANCRCDDECRDIGDCCSDIAVTCPVLRKFSSCLYSLQNHEHFDFVSFQLLETSPPKQVSHMTTWFYVTRTLLMDENYTTHTHTHM